MYGEVLRVVVAGAMHARPLWASGPAPTDPWLDGSGSPAITPL